MVKLKSKNLSLIPGPMKYKAGLTSDSLLDITSYKANEFIALMNNIPNLRIIERDDETYLNYKWIWEDNENTIKLSMTLLNGVNSDFAIWGGTLLELNSSSNSLIKLWKEIITGFPASYIHDNDTLEIYDIVEFQKNFSF